jgi:hypothetical protein
MHSNCILPDEIVNYILSYKDVITTQKFRKVLYEFNDYKFTFDILRQNKNSYWYNKSDSLFLIFITNNLLYTNYTKPYYWSFRKSLLENNNNIYERLICL